MNQADILTRQYHEAIKHIQNNCEHKNVDKKYRGDIGNWCPSDDRYWIEYTCRDCNKFWTEDQ